MSPLTLQEIIWEITNSCNKNCEYCGSKGVINNSAIIANPIEVAEKIAKYPPKEITLSGGEPGTLNENILKEVTNILRASRSQVKCVTNGLVIDNKYVQYFDWIGLSINTEEDISRFINEGYRGIHQKLTIITNFGTHNIWLFDKIKQLTYKPEGGIITWQIQLTQGKFQLPAEGIKYLRDKIAKDPSKIVKADNLQDCRNCFAGIHSCGILYTGDVIPCLSRRSWTKNLDVQGNILSQDLETIWKKNFENYRFGQMPCCRDSLCYPEEEKTETKYDPNSLGNLDNIVLLYGVQIDDYKKPPINTNGGVYAYAVVTQPWTEEKWPTITPLYACSTDTSTSICFDDYFKKDK